MTVTTTESESTAVDTSKGPSSSPRLPFRMDIHAWIETQQTSHGVRHDDYAQYHAYCTRKLARLAHNPSDARPYLVHSSKYASSTSTSSSSSGHNTKTRGGRHAFCSRSQDTFAPVQSMEEEVEGGVDKNETNTNNKKSYDVPHINVLWYLLVSAERCWAQANAMQKANKTIKAGAGGNNNDGKGGGTTPGGGGGKRQHVLRKLKRANGWASLLLEMATDNTDITTQYESQAYSSWMKANFALEKMKYQEASAEYARAMTLCYKLSALEDPAVPSTGGVDDGTTDQVTARRLQRQDLFVTRADTLLRPLFRYCQYELKRAGQPTLEEPRLKEGSQLTQSTSHEETIVFRGQDLVLDNKELRVLLLKLQSMEQDGASDVTRSTTGMGTKVGDDVGGQQEQHNTETQFLTALSILDDALEVIQSSQRGLASVSSLGGPALQAKLQQYALWRGYLQYCKTRKVMEHMEGLLENDAGMGHAERVHIYDTLLQHAKSLLNLPRPGQDETGVGGAADLEDDEFGLQVQANILRLRALKTYHMGWVYYRPPLNKHSNALALMEHCAELCKRAQEEIAACDEDMPHGDEYLKEMEELPVKSAMGAIRAAMMLQQRRQAQKLQAVGAVVGGDSAAAAAFQEPLATDRPLLLRLYEYDCGIPDAPIADVRPMPLPCKPVFYDLAFDYAMDPSKGVDRLEAFVREHTVSPLDEFEEGKDGEVGSGSGSFFGWLTGGSK